jgi:hypothetical protein
MAMGPSHRYILKKLGDEPQPDKTMDFSAVSTDFNSITLVERRIKPPSKILPARSVTNKKDAIRFGAKTATGAAAFYGVGPAIKRAVHKLPAAKTGRLADEVNILRNEARTIYSNMNLMIEQFDRVMKNTEASQVEKETAALLAFYFLEDCYAKFHPVLAKLKICSGLLKGNAVRGFGGGIVAAKPPRGAEHPYTKKEQAEKEIEAALLEEVANDYAPLQNALAGLEELGISREDYLNWKAENAVKIEVSLNTFKARGAMLGAAIQGLIFTGINLGIGAATMNPAIFAVGAYYGVSTIVTISEIAIKAKLQNDYIRHTAIESNKVQADVSRINMLYVAEDVHLAVDKLATTSFIVVANVNRIPITEAFRPIDTRRELPNAIYRP